MLLLLLSVKTAGTSGEESLFTRMLAVGLCASALFFFFLLDFFLSLILLFIVVCPTLLDIFQGYCLGVRVGRVAIYFFNLCPFVCVPVRNATLSALCRAFDHCTFVVVL